MIEHARNEMVTVRAHQPSAAPLISLQNQHYQTERTLISWC